MGVQARILVIDDELIVHQSVSRILSEEGHLVDSALRVDEALDRLKETAYDLVLTDLMIPEKNGMEAVKAVAQFYPDMGVVMFTGYPTVDSAVESMKLGSLDYLPKPFTPDELLQVVKRSLDQVQQTRRERELNQLYEEAEKSIQSSLELKEILQTVNENVVKLFKVKGSSLLLLNKKKQTLDLVSSAGLSEAYLSKGLIDATRSVPEVLESDQGVVIEEEQFDSRLQYPEAARREGIRSILSIPLKVKEAVPGILRLYGEQPGTFKGDTLQLVGKFADQAARAIENALAYAKVRHDLEDLQKFVPK
ncbi:MAG: response regulator [Deltaproteobacteria bacterium]|nr:response regulator [Deltaproteobacteria bacterium]